MRGLIRRSGPLGLLLGFFLAGLCWLSCSRLVHYGLHLDELAGLQDGWRLFAVGLRMDSVVLSYLLLPPALLLLLLPARHWRLPLVCAVLTGIAAFVIYMEVATLPFMAEYDSRPNRVFFEYLAYPREVISTLLKDYKLVMAAGSLFVGLMTWAVWRLCQRFLDLFPDWSYGRRLAWAPLVFLLLAVGARSGFGGKPAGISTAAFSPHHMANQLALNSSFTLLYAVYNLRHETDAERLYGALPWSESLRRVRRYTGLPEQAFTHTALPTWHRQPVAAGLRQPPNLVIFVQESLGARFVGSLGGLPLTPNLDRLSEEGLYFTRLYATGTRTVRGLEALVCGYPPTPAPGVLKLERSQENFFTIARLLQQRGYATEFIYGGDSEFDNMRGFFLRNGFERITDQDDFTRPSFVGTWGVSDEDLAARANERFRAYGRKPFFALMLSTSNHAPFEFPAGRVPPHEQPLNTRNNAVQYADHALGRFFELARREDYYANTVFLVVADHDPRVEGPELVPVERFHIPALVLGPGVPRGRFGQLASQLDLLPTLLHLMGIEAEHPMIGRDLLAQAGAGGERGRVLMQYGLINAFWSGDEVVVHQPDLPAATYRYRDGRLQPAQRDAELERDALAHLVWATRTYHQQLYRPAPPALLAGSPACARAPGCRSTGVRAGGSPPLTTDAKLR